MPELNRYSNSNFDEVFGKLQNVYRVRRGITENIVVPAVLFFPVTFGIITYIATRDFRTIPCCIALPVLMFSLAVWQIFSTRKDELRIYENGFTYKGGKNLEACLWQEIKTYDYRERNNREITELDDSVFPLGSVEKNNGEVIAFDFDLPGTPEIIARFEKSKTKVKLDFRN